MRVADRSTSRNYLKYLNSAKSDFSKTIGQVSSGKRFEKLSDDVAAGTRVLHNRMDKYKTDTRMDNVGAIADELTTAEDTLFSVNALLQRTKALVLQAASGEKGESGRSANAAEIKNLRKQLLAYANTSYGGKYLFGGSNSSTTEPFTLDENDRMLYNGIPVDDIQKGKMPVMAPDGSGFVTPDEGPDVYYYLDENDVPQEIPMDEDVYMDIGLGIRMNESQIEEGTGFKVSFSGLDIIGFGKDPVTGKSLNLYNTLLDLEEAIKPSDGSAADLEEIGSYETHLTREYDKFVGHMTDIGAQTLYLTNMETRLDKQSDNYMARISELAGVNDEEASITLAMNEYVLKAVQQMGSRILPLTLMDFLR